MTKQERAEYIHKLELEHARNKHEWALKAAKQAAFESNISMAVNFIAEMTRQEILRAIGLPNDIVK